MLTAHPLLFEQNASIAVTAPAFSALIRQKMPITVLLGCSSRTGFVTRAAMVSGSETSPR
jgi:hypothetical protein